MTYYLDKENKVLFIKFNSPTEISMIQELLKGFTNPDLPYKTIILDHKDELVIL